MMVFATPCPNRAPWWAFVQMSMEMTGKTSSLFLLNINRKFCSCMRKIVAEYLDWLHILPTTSKLVSHSSSFQNHYGSKGLMVPESKTGWTKKMLTTKLRHLFVQPELERAPSMVNTSANGNKEDLITPSQTYSLKPVQVLKAQRQHHGDHPPPPRSSEILWGVEV